MGRETGCECSNTPQGQEGLEMATYQFHGRYQTLVSIRVTSFHRLGSRVGTPKHERIRSVAFSHQPLLTLVTSPLCRIEEPPLLLLLLLLRLKTKSHSGETVFAPFNEILGRIGSAADSRDV